MRLKRLKRRYKIISILLLIFIFPISTASGENTKEFDALFNTANELFEIEEYSKALSVYHKALSLKPDSKEVMNNIGVTSRRQGLHREAEKYYLKAIDTDKKYLNPRVNLCILYYDRNMFNRIIEISDDLLKYSPKSGVAYFGKGFGYYKRRDYTKAVRFLKLSLKYRGKHSENYVEDAQVLLRKAKMKRRYRWGTR